MTGTELRQIRHWWGTHGVIGVNDPTTDRALGVACWGLDGDDTWSWWAGTWSRRQEGVCATKAEAQDAIRQVLRDLGWELP